MYDLIIVGSGPAGLTAAIYATRAKLNFIIIEQNFMSGGQVVNTYEVDNYPATPGINGMDLSMQMREHAEKLGAETLVLDNGGHSYGFYAENEELVQKIASAAATFFSSIARITTTVHPWLHRASPASTIRSLMRCS